MVSAQVDRVNALNDPTIQDVRVVNVEDVLNNSNVLNNVLHDADINLLSDLLDNSLNDLNVEILNDALNANNVAIADVVAVNVLSGGEVILFTR